MTDTRLYHYCCKSKTFVQEATINAANSLVLNIPNQTISQSILEVKVHVYDFLRKHCQLVSPQYQPTSQPKTVGPNNDLMEVTFLHCWVCRAAQFYYFAQFNHNTKKLRVLVFALDNDQMISAAQDRGVGTGITDVDENQLKEQLLQYLACPAEKAHNREMVGGRAVSISREKIPVSVKDKLLQGDFTWFTK